MTSARYDARRGELTTYFDRTAVEAWSRLTSDAPVSRIRATVRAGRDAMRATLLAWLPADMTGLRLVDDGRGTRAPTPGGAPRRAAGAAPAPDRGGAARGGPDVSALDASPTLVGLAQERLPALPGPGRIDFR